MGGLEAHMPNGQEDSSYDRKKRDDLVHAEQTLVESPPAALQQLNGLRSC